MRNRLGQFIKGERAHPETEFRKGEHWRPHKPHWDKAWLEEQYLQKGRSAADIAKEEGCREESIFHWLRKYAIPRRNVSEARKRKHWGASGERNPMFGKRGAEAPNWKGGGTPERQAFYSSVEWGMAVKAVWSRDRAKCQRCSKKAIRRGIFHIHHKVTFGVKEIRTNLGNLVLLCPACHRFVHSPKNTEHTFIGIAQLAMEGGEITGRDG